MNKNQSKLLKEAKIVKLLKEVKIDEPYTIITEQGDTFADMYLESIDGNNYSFQGKLGEGYCEFTQSDINEGYVEVYNTSPLWKGSNSKTKSFIKEAEEKDPDAWQKKSYNSLEDSDMEDKEDKDSEPLQEDEIDMEQLKANARQIKHCGDYGILHVNHDNGKVCWTAGDADCNDEYTSEEEISNLLKVPGVTEVEIADEYYPNKEDGYEKVDFEKKEEAPKQKLKEDMTTADMASFDTPVGFNKKRMETFDPYKGMQNVVDGSKTRINEDIDQNFEVMPNTFKECEEKGKLQVIVKEGGKKKIYKFKESEFTKFIDLGVHLSWAEDQPKTNPYAPENITVMPNVNGALSVFVANEAGLMAYKDQSYPGEDLKTKAWGSITEHLMGQPDIVAYPNGAMTVFGHGADARERLRGDEGKVQIRFAAGHHEQAAALGIQLAAAGRGNIQLEFVMAIRIFVARHGGEALFGIGRDFGCGGLESFGDFGRGGDSFCDRRSRGRGINCGFRFAPENIFQLLWNKRHGGSRAFCSRH